MNFPPNVRKAAQAVARILEKSGGSADYLRVMKLLYLADRESIVRRGIPISGGKYYSMRKGPVIGDAMNLVNHRNSDDWKGMIAPRVGHNLSLQSPPSFDELSEAEVDVLDEIVDRHLTRSTEELVKWCHDHCGEYTSVHLWTRKPISVESILRAEKKTQDQIDRVVSEAQSISKLDAMLA